MTTNIHVWVGSSAVTGGSRVSPPEGLWFMPRQQLARPQSASTPRALAIEASAVRLDRPSARCRRRTRRSLGMRTGLSPGRDAQCGSASVRRPRHRPTRLVTTGARPEDLGIAIDHHRPALCLGDHLGSGDTFLPGNLARPTLRPDRDGDDRPQGFVGLEFARSRDGGGHVRGHDRRLKAGEPGHFGVSGRNVPEREDILLAEYPEVWIDLDEPLRRAGRRE